MPCRLFHNPYGCEFKMIIPLRDRKSATISSRAQQANGVIPVLSATGVDIPRDDANEVMAYVESLTTTEPMIIYPYCDDWKPDMKLEEKQGKSEATEDDRKIILQGNVWTLLLLEGCSEMFATGEFIEDSADNI